MRLKPGVGRSRAVTWRHAIPVLTLFAGTLFAASASTARGTDLRGGSRTKVTELISQEQRGYQGPQAVYRRLRRQVDELGRRAGRTDARVRAAQQDADRLAAVSGFTPVSGRGVRVSLDDAPRVRHVPDGTSPDDL